MLTIKSGKKGPHIKKGMVDTIIKLIKTEFEYLKLFIRLFKLKNYFFLIFTTLFSLLSIILGNFKLFFKSNCCS